MWRITIKNWLYDLRYFIGRLLWYFVSPHAHNLCSDYAIGLIDRDELDCELYSLRHDISMLESGLEDVRGGFE